MQTIYQIEADKYAPYAQMLNNMMQGYERSYQEKRQRNMGNADLQAMNQYLMQRGISPANMQLNPMLSASGSGSIFANPQMNQGQNPQQMGGQLPQFQTPGGMEMAQKMLQQQMMSPLEQAQAEYTKRRLQNGNQEFSDAPWYMNDKYKNTPEAKIASGQKSRAYGARMRIVKGADGYYGIDPTTGEQTKLEIPIGDNTATDFDNFLNQQQNGGADANSIQSTGEPKSLEEFYANTETLKTKNVKKAKEYYNKWAKKWQ
ncbi:MAG: hypothetical protein WC356_02705 [Candidatus Micrarchaeia archaeon]|jgi:hypothetical protein